MKRHIAPRRSRSARSGFTLLEVMIATAVTLLMMISLAKIFNVIGTSMKQGRATLELNNRLRDVAYRIRRDLGNLTVNADPPANAASGTGYLQYYDGPQTDYTTTLHYANRLITPTPDDDDDPDASKIGDVDDILMFTARAGDVWFTGKVPAFVLERRAPINASEVNDLVSIGAQHAEIAVFCEPVVSSSKPGLPPPADGYSNPERNPAYLVANTGFFKDVDGDGFPDAYRLHYRTLLIRPDLNTNTGSLPFNRNPPKEIFTAGPETVNLPDGTRENLASPLCDMSGIHNVCDLSIRRVYDGNVATRDLVAANSLEDLMDPANRFAHVQLPHQNLPTVTMPLLALESTNGFLHPAFTLLGDRIGEDILASDILAFDVKGYDPGCVLLASAGVNTVDDLGAAGSDDLLLSPNDPGYAVALAQIIANQPQPVPYAAGTGEYVDLAWAHKIRQHFLSILPQYTRQTNVWTQLSGYSENNYFATNGNMPFTESLYKSGMIIFNNSVLNQFQPSYDTWTTRYEGDGVLQAELQNTRGTQVVFNTSSTGPALRDGWRKLQNAYVVDAATDGIDNNIPPAGGVDDISENETSAPFPVKLRGLKVSIRMEDAGTREVRQMSVAQELVTQ